MFVAGQTCNNPCRSAVVLFLILAGPLPVLKAETVSKLGVPSRVKNVVVHHFGRSQGEFAWVLWQSSLPNAEYRSACPARHVV